MGYANADQLRPTSKSCNSIFNRKCFKQISIINLKMQQSKWDDAEKPLNNFFKIANR